MFCSGGIPFCFTDDSVSLGGETCGAGISPVNERIDCHPEPNANKDYCLGRGCYWCDPGSTAAPMCSMPAKRGYR